MFCGAGFLVLTMVFAIYGSVWYTGFFATIICMGLEANVRLPEFMQSIVNTVDEHSYTLYLVHGIVFCSLIDKIEYGIPKALIGIIAVTASFLLTAIIHKYIEKPIQSMLKEKMLSSI